MPRPGRPECQAVCRGQQGGAGWGGVGWGGGDGGFRAGSRRKAEGDTECVFVEQCPVRFGENGVVRAEMQTGVGRSRTVLMHGCKKWWSDALPNSTVGQQTDS